MDYAMLSSNEISGRIGKAYSEALKDIQKQLKDIFRNFSADISEAEAQRILKRVSIDRDGDITESLKKAIALVKDEKKRAELTAELNAPAYKARMQRLKELSRDIGEKCSALAQGANSSLDRGLEDIIRDTYYRGVFDMQQRAGIAFSFSKVSERMIKEILQQNWSGAHYSKRIWGNTDELAELLQQTLMKGVLTGASSGRMANEIMERFHASYSRALTLTRTESSYCANSAELSRYKDTEVKKYRYVATLDSRTSDVCRKLDGKEFPVSDAKAGTNYPPMHPRCRSTTIEALSQELISRLKRRARNPETGELVTVPADMTYKEWYGKYVEGGELTGRANGGIIKSINVDDYDLIVSGKKIAPEVNDVILTTMKQCEKDGGFVISEISDKVEPSESGGTPVLQIVPMSNGLLKLNVNVQYLSGKSLEEVNQAFVHTERNLAQSLEEAVIHESGHAISIKGKTAPEVDRFYQELKNQGKPGVSDIALSDGAELLAELEILRHRKTPVSKELSDFYEKYTGRKYL